MNFWKSIIILVLSGVALSFLITASKSSSIDRILASTNTEEQSKILKELLEEVGPEEAQEELLHSGLPFTGQTHLLVHTVGNFVYDTYGLDGLKHCKDYFLSACYHGFILNTLGDHGMAGMVDVMEKCESAGPGVLPQCAHGSGHGFVAWQDYDLLKALEMCDELGLENPEFPHFNCYDGVFMENFWGVHNGVPSEKRWVKTGDIYYPCNDPRIPEKYLKGCWSNQATAIYQYMKGNLRKTALACDRVENETYRDTCYNNFGRQIHPLTQGRVDKVFSLCKNATGKVRQDECVLTNMRAYFSVGDRILPRKICEATDGELKNKCLSNLDGMIKYYNEK